MGERVEGVRAAVTVERAQEELDGSAALDPLRRLGNQVEFSLRPAPGAWGTEVHASWRGAGTVAEARATLQRAVREVRQLAEAVEVLRNEPRPAGRRRTRPGGAIVDWAERNSDRFERLRRLW